MERHSPQVETGPQADGQDRTQTAAGQGRRRADWPLIGWFGASSMLLMPQAAAPVAFGLLSLSLTGAAQGGAAMMMVMTLAQILCAVPITRATAHLSPVRVIRWLILARTLAFAGVTALALTGAPFLWLILLAVPAGAGNGAAYGYLRALLGSLVPETRFPRALGIASTLNELTFVTGPVAASALGVIDPVWAVLALTLAGALPALLVPNVEVETPEMPEGGARLLTGRVQLWLACAAAGGATVAALEVGAVALALRFEQAPTMAVLFTVPLCAASVCGGLWVSFRNRMARHPVVVAQLCVMAAGIGLVAAGLSLPLTILGAMLVGAVLPPLGTTYMLVVDRLVPRHRRAEAFAMIRTANAIGVIFASGLLALTSLPLALLAVAVVMAAMAALVAVHPRAMGDAV
ncbi:MFS transporter [Ferrimonas balearica]|nr:MFS transporter [Ferrimonas balearica]